MGLAAIPQNRGGSGRSTRPRNGGGRAASRGNVRRRRAAARRRDAVRGPGSGRRSRQTSLGSGTGGGSGRGGGLNHIVSQPSAVRRNRSLTEIGRAHV